MVAGRTGVCDHRMELVGYLLCRYCQQVLLLNRGAFIVLVEVHDEGGEVRGFLAYVGDGP